MVKGGKLRDNRYKLKEERFRIDGKNIAGGVWNFSS